MDLKDDIEGQAIERVGEVVTLWDRLFGWLMRVCRSAPLSKGH